MSYNENTPLALEIIPPRSFDKEQEQIPLETVMQSLVLSSKHPVALEMVGTEAARRFVIRATTPISLEHIKSQLQTLYPQLGVRPVLPSWDHFHLEENEEVHAVEFKAGVASYLPLRTWREQEEKDRDTADPVLGLLAALSHLPPGMRIITQLSLLPAAPNWSKKHLRKAVEHALESEKRDRMALSSIDKNGDVYRSNVMIGVIAAILVLVLLIQQLLPEGIIPSLFQQDRLVTTIWTIVIGISIATLLTFLIRYIWRFFFPVPIYDMQLVRQKTLRAAYHVRLRAYIINAVDEKQLEEDANTSSLQNQQKKQRNKARQEYMLRISAAYRQYNLAGGAYFKEQTLSQATVQKLTEVNEKGVPGWSRWIKRSPHILSVDALAALWHFPASSRLIDLALVTHRQARSLQIPPDLVTLFANQLPVGYSEHAGYRLPFALIPQFFRSHILIGGKSGEGKSTCIDRIAREAMAYGGLVLVDPHGDLCDQVLSQVPEHRRDDVVLIDLAEKDFVVGLNPLDVMLGRSRDKAVADLVKTFSHIWPEAWGPRMENAFEMALRTLIEANTKLIKQYGHDGGFLQYTLLDVLSVLTNERFCAAILHSIGDVYLHRWWRDYFDPLTLMQQRDVVNPVLTKVSKFESVLARRIVGQSLSTLNLSSVIEEKKILLVKLAKGIVGADVAALVGATILNLLQVTLEEQGNKGINERVHLPIILDEFQVLTGVDYSALAELRKYGATFVLATQSLQYLEKLDPILLPTVLANARQMIIFHMSAEDAEILAPELGIEPENILSLNPHMCYIKMAAGGQRYPVFSVTWEMSPSGDRQVAETIREYSRTRYARTSVEIDEMLQIAMQRNMHLDGNILKGEKMGNTIKAIVNKAHARNIDSTLITEIKGNDSNLPETKEQGNGATDQKDVTEQQADQPAPSSHEVKEEKQVDQAQKKRRRGSRGSGKSRKEQKEVEIQP